MKTWLKGGLIGAISAFAISILVGLYAQDLTIIIAILFAIPLWFLIGAGIGLMFQKKINTLIKVVLVLIMLIPLLYSISTVHIGTNCPFKEGYHVCDNLPNPESCLKDYRQTCLNFECSHIAGSDTCRFDGWITGILFPFFNHGTVVVAMPLLISLALIVLSATKVLKDKK